MEVSPKLTIEYLSQIREQEELADKIRQEGLLESKRIVNAAAEEAAAMIKAAKKEADMLYRETIKRAEAEADEGCESIITHAEWECQMLLKEAEEKLDGAVSIIVDKVVDEWQS
jgi:V/A-type H+-transporting ATPase subunit G/H